MKTQTTGRPSFNRSRGSRDSTRRSRPGESCTSKNRISFGGITPNRTVTRSWSMNKKYGSIPLKTFPLYDTRLKKYVHNFLRVKSYSPLNYLDYNKEKVKELLIKELNWRDYGGKHYESVFTRFYQGYILPTKFNVDKRKAHLSTLICAGQITKEEALSELKKPIYDPELLKQDKSFVLKKLGITESEFDSYMKLPVRSHYDFPVERPLHERYPVLRPLRTFMGQFTNHNV